MAPLLTVIGDLVEDIVVWSRSIRPGTDNPATVHRTRGGSAANVATVAAALGPTRFIGRVGDDDAGRRLVSELAACGVDVRAQIAGTTGAVVVIVTADGERTMFPDRGAAAELDSIDPTWLVATTILHVPAYGLVDERTARVLAGAAAAVRSSGGAISVDLSAVPVVEAIGRHRLRSLLGELGASLVFANRAEAATAGIDTLAGATCVVKDGPRPTTVVAVDGSSHTVAVPPVDGVRDTTGAGDAFAAGFLAAWMRSADPCAAARAGHSSAATVLRTAGAAAQPYAPRRVARA
jgi:sugar/nucleoside kinase (ribokinase family)